MLLRIGILSARAAEAGAASEAFARAARVNVSDPLPCELRGSLSAWAPEVVSAEHAAESYLEAAERREHAGAIDAQLENLWRAFDADPTSDRVAAALAAALARARSPARRRRGDARARGGDPGLATRARDRACTHGGGSTRSRRKLCPARWRPRSTRRSTGRSTAPEGTLSTTSSRAAGLIELLAVRIELRAERAKAPERARLLEQLGRLFAGPPGQSRSRRGRVRRRNGRRSDAHRSARRAARARGAAARPRTAGRGAGSHARDRGRATPGRERSGRWARGSPARERSCAVAEEQLADPSLAAWAAERLLRLDPDDYQARASLARAESRRGPAHERLEAARDAVSRGESLPAPARVNALRALALALRGAPLEGAARARVLAELADARPETTRASWPRRTGPRGLAEIARAFARSRSASSRGPPRPGSASKRAGTWPPRRARAAPGKKRARPCGLFSTRRRRTGWPRASSGLTPSSPAIAPTRARALVRAASSAPARLRTALLGAAATALARGGRGRRGAPSGRARGAPRSGRRALRRRARGGIGGCARSGGGGGVRARHRRDRSASVLVCFARRRPSSAPATTTTP